MRENNIDINKLISEAKSGNLEAFLDKHLSAGDRVKLNNILSDKSKTEKMLNTPQAKELMKKLSKDK